MTYQVKNRFQSLPFKYTTCSATPGAKPGDGAYDVVIVSGATRLSLLGGAVQVGTRSSKAPGFNPRANKVKPRFQALCFQMQLVPLRLGLLLVFDAGGHVSHPAVTYIKAAELELDPGHSNTGRGGYVAVDGELVARADEKPGAAGAGAGAGVGLCMLESS
jgi:hypothetical protein